MNTKCQQEMYKPDLYDNTVVAVPGGSADRWVVCAVVCRGDIMLVGPRHYSPCMHQQIDNMSDAANLEWVYNMPREKQGFIDQWCNYMSREEAKVIAEANGQVSDVAGDIIFSEDLY